MTLHTGEQLVRALNNLFSKVTQDGLVKAGDPQGFVNIETGIIREDSPIEEFTISTPLTLISPDTLGKLLDDLPAESRTLLAFGLLNSDTNLAIKGWRMIPSSSIPQGDITLQLIGEGSGVQFHVVHEGNGKVNKILVVPADEALLTYPGSARLVAKMDWERSIKDKINDAYTITAIALHSLGLSEPK